MSAPTTPHAHHHHVDPKAGDGRIAFAIAVNIGLTLVQIVGGIFSGSLALIADALHNFSDAIALIIAFAARRIARRPADEDMTFGYQRVETVAALINYVSLIIIGLFLVYEAVMRFFAPNPVAGWTVVIVAAVALVVDLATAALTYAMSRTSMNIRAAFLHNVADALGSVAVIIAGFAILMLGWNWVDPAVTLMIAGYILWQSFAEIGPVIRILVQGTPPGVDPQAVLDRLKTVEGVTGVHHAHFWQMDEHANAMEAHITLQEGRWGDADAIKAELKKLLHDEFEVTHSSLELECARHACSNSPAVGHG